MPEGKYIASRGEEGSRSLSYGGAKDRTVTVVSQKPESELDFSPDGDYSITQTSTDFA